MDTLKAVSVPPTQSYGLVSVPAQKGEAPGGSVIAEDTATIPARLAEQENQDNKQQITDTVKDINNFFQMEQRSLAFTLDEASGQLVMQIRDIKTNDLIRQIPGEDVLKLAKRLDDLTGIIFKARA